MQQRPFVFSGLFAAGFAVVMMLMLLGLPGGAGVTEWLPRATCALLGSLGLAAAEALWRVRPWAWRVCAALALAHTLAALGWGLAKLGWEGVGAAGGYLFFTSFVVVPILANVYQRTVAPPHLAGGRRPVHAPVRPVRW
ncbi:MAG TPA: hypothetical protein VFJ82_11915 [Longimicrobium sp.]|nr:hypothetical protein [Longimicrobium sp.]